MKARRQRYDVVAETVRLLNNCDMYYEMSDDHRKQLAGTRNNAIIGFNLKLMTNDDLTTVFKQLNIRAGEYLQRYYPEVHMKYKKFNNTLNN